MIAIIDYGVGNLNSVKNMLKKAGIEDVEISADSSIINYANKLILPGVGAFDAGIQRLNESGLVDLIRARVFENKIPILGICLGMQLLTNKSEEGAKPGLGWVNAETVKFKFDESNQKLKVPHMGWNYVNVKKENPLFSVSDQNRFYFVHSYYVKCANENDILSTTNYGSEFVSAFKHENIYGAQFHPEKSLRFGMNFLKKFAEL